MTNTYDDLGTALAILSDIRSSIKVTKRSCPQCSNERWEDWPKYQVRNNLDGAISRVGKAMEIINEG
mgnify:FL=1